MKSPSYVTNEGKPENMQKLAKFIGKEPEVKLHGSANWKKARDTGAIATAKAEATGLPVEEGTTSGQIESYRPNPNLFGEQGS